MPQYTWNQIIQKQLQTQLMQELNGFLKERRQEVNVYPATKNIFKAFELTPYQQTRVVVLGQDPYHTPGAAHGLAFSSMEAKTPPSLRNIFKEIQHDMGYDDTPLHELFPSNNLTDWAKQGVLLLNTALTVEEGSPGIHTTFWRPFILTILEALYQHHDHLIWLLWGQKAQNIVEQATGGHFGTLNNTNHTVFKAAHPSPFSANNFFGCGHFSRTNALIEFLELGKPIKWTLNS